jgi:hypothetical protein
VNTSSRHVTSAVLFFGIFLLAISGLGCGSSGRGRPEANTVGHAQDVKSPERARRTTVRRTIMMSQPGGQGAIRAVAWRAKPVEGSRVLRLLLTYNWCGGPNMPRVQRVETVEKTRTTTITAFVFFPAVKARYGHSACLQTSLLEPVKISLRDDAFRSALYDGSTSPPVRRWSPSES